ncbi:ATP-dependent DNA ligase clustered with Ku protein, LigD [Candidatus Paraburkholderia kirkii UZHbot1]|uniref:DNA ligase (ATP) n=1 Tax=Candidatus Paraburkholderia kirkii UZHbot1 TaxID=1055526 RepID=G4M3I6_9BURK|nr:ATP-dependent DNA ligase clustered with Ku protein, LigD [Candidatus Paraburkholderia kirkii UZHbot1]
MASKLETYQRMRSFDKTLEPSGAATHGARAKPAAQRALSFVIQEHDARRLHYDFRLELDGTLKSWAVPKGPSLDPSVKRLAVHVEDHPLDYGSFEGEIPEGNYGAGSVIVWDRGTWAPQSGSVEEAARNYEKGKLKFTLDGEKLHGGWTLVKSHMRGSGDKEQWLLIKERDEEARPEAEYDILSTRPGSVMSDSLGARTKSGVLRERAEGKASAKKATARKVTTKKANGHDHPDIVASQSAESLRALSHEPAIEGAVKAKLPSSFEPLLATLVDAATPGDDWAYEIKFDGYRVLARIETVKGRREIRIFTRNGNDWTTKFSKQVKALDGLDIESGWLDGEAVVLDERGRPDFQALQNAFDVGRPQDIVVYFFDVPYLNGYDLRKVPLVQRRAILKALIEPVDDPMLRYSQDFAFHADELLKSACDMGLEGIIGKRIDGAYVSGRGTSWIKLKCRRRQEFVIGGYSEPSGSRGHFGALLLGVYDTHGKLQYAGRVGTGFDHATLVAVKKELDKREVERMPFASEPQERSRTPVHWVKPELVAECNFAEWTKERIVRQASFVSLRGDKPARQIVKEEPASAKKVAANPAATKTAAKKTTAAKRPTSAVVEGVKISHPDRVFDKSTGLCKADVVEYYTSVAEWMLPHLKDRPVSLVRAPEDIGGELFFQKHSAKLAIPHITQHPDIDPGHPPLLTIESPQALVGTAQMGTIELHTWNALASNIEKPDRMVFDLDPGEGVGWERMIEAARLTNELLAELGLESFCKTSGGKGFHVIVPLVKQAGWDEMKDFSQAVAQRMASTLPKLFSAKMGMQNRKGKIFIDYLRNNRGSSTVAAFSLRARPGLGASMPLAWDELEDVTSGDQWNIGNVRERLDALKRDLWAGYDKARKRLTAEMKKRLGMNGSRK